MDQTVGAAVLVDKLVDLGGGERDVEGAEAGAELFKISMTVGEI